MFAFAKFEDCSDNELEECDSGSAALSLDCVPRLLESLGVSGSVVTRDNPITTWERFAFLSRLAVCRVGTLISAMIKNFTIFI